MQLSASHKLFCNSKQCNSKETKGTAKLWKAQLEKQTNKQKNEELLN